METHLEVWGGSCLEIGTTGTIGCSILVGEEAPVWNLTKWLKWEAGPAPNEWVVSHLLPGVIKAVWNHSITHIIEAAERYDIIHQNNDCRSDRNPEETVPRRRYLGCRTQAIYFRKEIAEYQNRFGIIYDCILLNHVKRNNNKWDKSKSWYHI